MTHHAQRAAQNHSHCQSHKVKDIVPAVSGRHGLGSWVVLPESLAGICSGACLKMIKTARVGLPGYMTAGTISNPVLKIPGKRGISIYGLSVAAWLYNHCQYLTPVNGILPCYRMMTMMSDE